MQREVVAEAVQANLVVLGDAPQVRGRVHRRRRSCDLRVRRRAAGSRHRRAAPVWRPKPSRRCPPNTCTATRRGSLLRGLAEAGKAEGIKGKALYHPLRVALSGRDEGPELFYLIAGLGKSRTIWPGSEAAARFRGPPRKGTERASV